MASLRIHEEFTGDFQAMIADYTYGRGDRTRKISKVG